MLSVGFLEFFLKSYAKSIPLQKRLKSQYWFDCCCIPCQESWPLMHEMTDDVLNFRCPACGGSVPFHTSSNNPMLKCECGTAIPMLKV